MNNSYLTEQQRHPFRNSSHSSNNSPSCPIDIDFSMELPKNEKQLIDFHKS